MALDGIGPGIRGVVMGIFDRYPELRRCIVNLKSGTTFAGVIWKKRRGFLVLRNVQLLKAKSEAVTMDGELLVYVNDVDFIQVVGQ
jgi:hypothetical protein